MSGDALLPLISMSLHKTFRMQRYAIGIIHNIHAVASYSGSPSPFFTYCTHMNIVFLHVHVLKARGETHTPPVLYATYMRGSSPYPYQCIQIDYHAATLKRYSTPHTCTLYMYIREVKSMVSVDLRSLHKFIENPSLVPRLHPQKEERVWYTLSAFWGVQDAACHVIVMTRHCFGMATHQRLSHAAIVGYSMVSHDNHVQATWRESD